MDLGHTFSDFNMGNQMRIYHEKPHVVSESRIWVAHHKEYIYFGDTLPKLIINIIKNWNNDRNLVM